MVRQKHRRPQVRCVALAAVVAVAVFGQGSVFAVGHPHAVP